jgi:hypothetical protein
MPRKRAVMSQREKLQGRSQHFYHGRRECERQRGAYEERWGMSTRTNGRSWAFLVARQFSASRHDHYRRRSSWRLRGPESMRVDALPKGGVVRLNHGRGAESTTGTTRPRRVCRRCTYASRCRHSIEALSHWWARQVFR